MANRARDVRLPLPMPSPQRLSLTAAAFMLIACRDASPGPKADELAKVSPEMFSHADPAVADDAKCLGTDGILVTAIGVGPVQIGRRLRVLRQRCEIAYVKVPGSVAIKGPVLGVSVGGGLILFTVGGPDSAVETLGTSSPAFRTSTGIGVGTGARNLRPTRGSLCFKRNSVQIVEIFVSRQTLRC